MSERVNHADVRAMESKFKEFFIIEINLLNVCTQGALTRVIVQLVNEGERKLL